MWRHVAGRRDSMICLFLWVLQLGGVNGLWLMAPIARFGRGFRGPASRRAEVSSGKYRATWWHHRCRKVVGILRNPSGAIPSWQSQGPFDENRPKCFKLFETQKMIHLGRDYIILYILYTRICKACALIDHFFRGIRVQMMMIHPLLWGWKSQQIYPGSWKWRAIP